MLDEPQPGSLDVFGQDDRSVNYFHVTPSVNRESIERHGLDWRYMAAAPGIAGSRSPEQDGCFLCRSEFETEWFVRMGSRRGPVDVWEVADIDEVDLIDAGSGFYFVPFSIPTTQLRLVRRDAQLNWPNQSASHGANRDEGRTHRHWQPD